MPLDTKIFCNLLVTDVSEDSIRRHPATLRKLKTFWTYVRQISSLNLRRITDYLD